MAYRICAPTQGSEREYEIAVTYNKPYAEHTEANARLLAAGPAMYLALYKIAQWRALVEQNKDDALLTITREAMQALDQVEGRA